MRKIKLLEESFTKKEEELNELRRKDESEERNSLKKKNILQRLEDLENKNNEKDKTIAFLTERVDKLLHQIEHDETEKAVNLVPCELCDFYAKNERGLKLHIKARHEITKVEINVFCKATEKYLSSDRDLYRKELETEIDILEDIIDMDIDSSTQ